MVGKSSTEPLLITTIILALSEHIYMKHISKPQWGKMLGICKYFVFIFSPFCIGGNFTLNNTQVMQTLAMSLGFSCLTVIVENVDRIDIKEMDALTRFFPTVISGSEDLEKVSKLVKKDRNKCLNFAFISNESWTMS